jgi:hypothetical protein
MEPQGPGVRAAGGPTEQPPPPHGTSGYLRSRAPEAYIFWGVG